MNKQRTLQAMPWYVGLQFVQLLIIGEPVPNPHVPSIHEVHVAELVAVHTEDHVPALQLIHDEDELAPKDVDHVPGMQLKQVELAPEADDH